MDTIAVTRRTVMFTAETPSVVFERMAQWLESLPDESPATIDEFEFVYGETRFTIIMEPIDGERLLSEVGDMLRAVKTPPRTSAVRR